MTAAEKPCLDCGTPISVKKTSGRCTLCYRKNYRKVKLERQTEDTDAASIATTSITDPQEESSRTPKKTCKDCNKELPAKRKNPRCKDCKAVHKTRKSRRAKEDPNTTDDEPPPPPPPKCSSCNATLAAPSASNRCQKCEEKEMSEEVQQREEQPPEEKQLSKTEELPDVEQFEEDQRSKEGEAPNEGQIREAESQYDNEQQVLSENVHFREEAHFAGMENRWNDLNGHAEERAYTCDECGTSIPSNFTTRRCLECEKKYLTEEDTGDDDDDNASTRDKRQAPVCRDCGSEIPHGLQSNQCRHCYSRHISKTMPTKIPTDQHKCSTCGTEIPGSSKSAKCTSCNEPEVYGSMDPQPNHNLQATDQCDRCGASVSLKRTNGTRARCAQCNSGSSSPNHVGTAIYSSYNEQTTTGCCECDPSLPPGLTTGICSNCATKVIIDDPTPSLVHPSEQPSPAEMTCFECQKPISPDATAGRCLPCYQKLLYWQIGEQTNGNPVNGSVSSTSMDNGSVNNGGVHNDTRHSDQALPRQCTSCDTVMLSNTKSDQCQKCSQSQATPQTNGTNSRHPLSEGALPKCRGCGCAISPIVRNGLCARCFANRKSSSTENRRGSLVSSHSDSRSSVTKDPVIAACRLQNESSHCKSLTRTMVSGMGLVPFDIRVGDKKFTALIHPDALSDLTGYNGDEQVSFTPCLDVQDKQQYKYTIDASRYMEIGEEHEELLNSSWMNNPKIKYAATDLLSGCLIVVGKQILKVQCLEPYGYLQYIDVHWQRFGHASKNEPGLGDFSSWYGRYSKVAVGNLHDTDGREMLVIATPEGTFLVTASTRLDKPNPNCDIGPITYDFKPSPYARIFLSRKSMASSRVLNTFRLYNHSDLQQLRDVRSKFVNKSTYHLCRGTSLEVKWQNLRPVTLWTLADVADDDDEWAIVNSKIFQTVALSVIHNKCQLYKQDMEALLYGCSEDAGRYVKEILGIFKPGLAYVHILKNWDLNRILSEIAHSLGPSIDQANATVKLNMQKYFNKMNPSSQYRINDGQNSDEEL